MTAAEPGSSPRNPQTIDPSGLDLSGLRAHCREQHTHAANRSNGGLPRANLDLAAWHARQHHRYRPRHGHYDPPWVLVRSRHTGRTTGQTPRPIGWYTGQDAKSREQVRAEFVARMAARKGDA